MHGMRKKQEPIYSCPTTETTIKWITEILSKIHLRFEKKTGEEATHTFRIVKHQRR